MEYTRLNSLDGVAYYLGISRVTIWSYLNDKVNVYDRKLKIEFFNTIKRWETKRNALHDRMLLFFAAFPNLWIYLHKNFHGIHDATEEIWGTLTLKRRANHWQRSKIDRECE